MTDFGIVSYGSYIPRYFHVVNHPTGIVMQRVAHPYENSVTMAYHASEEAINRASINKNDISSIWVGSETKTNKVGSDSIIIADKLGLNNILEAMDVELACASGLASIIKACREASHPDFKGKYSLVIATDCSRISRDNTFYNLVGHAATAFIIGEKPIASVSTNGIAGYTSYQNDFFVSYDKPKSPVCDGKKSIHEYKKHFYASVNNYLNGSDINANYIIIHTPVPKIIDWITFNDRDCYADNPFKGMTKERVKSLFKYNTITAFAGNTFPSNCMLNLINWLDHAITGENSIVCNYGSGSTVLRALVTADEDINNFDRSIKLADKIAPNSRFMLSDELFEYYMKGEVPTADDFKGNALNINDLKNAKLVSFNKDKSVVELNNGSKITAEVVGCSNLAPGTNLEPTFKQLKLPNSEIIYKIILREKLKHSST